jgi:hypothetical protein
VSGIVSIARDTLSHCHQSHNFLAACLCFR